jgi:hypothetical protein
VPLTVGETESDGSFGRIGPENLIEDGLQEEDAKGVKYADHGQEQNSRKPLEPEWKAVANETHEILHAGWPAWRAQIAGTNHGYSVRNSIPVLYPAQVGSASCSNCPRPWQ